MPDWVPDEAGKLSDSLELPRPTGETVNAPGAWESTEFSRAKADAVRWLHAALSAGQLRAYGRRAIVDADEEWIPRAEWEGLPDIRTGQAWRHLFLGLPAFVLSPGKPAWCEVAVYRPRHRPRRA